MRKNAEHSYICPTFNVRYKSDAIYAIRCIRSSNCTEHFKYRSKAIKSNLNLIKIKEYKSFKGSKIKRSSNCSKI